MLGLMAAPTSPMDFARDVHPLFAGRCVFYGNLVTQLRAVAFRHGAPLAVRPNDPQRQRPAGTKSSIT